MKFMNSHKVNCFLKDRFWSYNRLFHWNKLRVVGNLYILKISYAALIIMPWMANHYWLFGLLKIPLWNYVAAYFASLSLAMANLLYDLFCPIIVKRFASPADLYKGMLDIKISSASCYPEDNYNASLEHCITAYNEAVSDKPLIGSLCASLFILAACLFAVILIARSFDVLGLAILSMVHSLRQVPAE
jgi:hypothetical protein